MFYFSKFKLSNSKKMKKIITIVICLVAFICITNTVQAQKYLQFESKTFSVLLKCSPDYTKVMQISFSTKGAWEVYKIDKVLPLANKTATGNIFEVEDAKANKFAVEYSFVKDKFSCSVVDHKAGTRTILNKK